jgi:Sugar (and other) transporter
MCLRLIGNASYFSFIESSADSSNFSWLPVMSLSIFVLGFGIGMGPVSYVLLGELFLQEAKVYVAPVAQTLNFAFSFVISLTFLMLIDAIGLGPTFFMFTGFCALALVFTVFFIPETKGKTIEEIQKLLS